ncbi:MAG: tRNA-dihydrouridine synthase [Candidatus Methanomethylophilaceae archaeon]|nr:tRNA-dihydrouridine synthase [Candidatus Methanomethylophilaceae archaeon]
MWRIGDLEFDGHVVLGPMSGFSFNSYRRFMRPFGVAVSVTEMVSSMGLVYGQKRTGDYVRFEADHPTGMQLFGSRPEAMAEAARIALETNPTVSFLDVNMGCPVPKVIRSSSGSALMKDPARCGDIVRAMKDAVDVPVTVKTRLGWDMDSVNYRDVLEEVVSAGADAITIHARTKEELYTGRPHFDMMADLQSDLSVPLIVSGNIYSVEDAVNAMETTGATAVMVARGGVGNPFLVTQIDSMIRTGRAPPNPTISQQVDWCLELVDMVLEEKGPDMGISKLRSIAPRFVSGCRDCREFRRKLAREAFDRDNLVRILLEVRDEMGDQRVRSHGMGACHWDDDL